MMAVRVIIVLLVFMSWSCNSGDARKADRLFDQGNYQEAIDAYSSYLLENPRNIEAIYNRGRSYEEIGKFAEAEGDFEEVTKLDEKNINAYLSLAKLNYEQKKYSRALLFSENALEINENSADGYFLNARAQHQLGYADGAMEAYTLAIKINSNFGEAYLYRGALKINKKLTRSACEDFKKAENLEVAHASSIRETYCN